MKNTILILISVLMIVYGALTLVSSGDDYAAERLFYRAMKTNRKIADNPDVAPPKMLSYVEDNLQKLLKTYPETKAAKTAHFTLVEFYLNNKKYAQARSILDDIIKIYAQDKVMLSKAYFFRGVAYEKEGRWDEAQREYAILQDRYADTPVALGVPLHIGDYYRKKKRYTQAQQAYNQAVLFYKKLKTETKGEARGYVVANLLLRAYMELKQYEQAGEVLEDIVNDYPKLLTLVQQVPNVELIFVKMLRRPEKAIEIYNNMRAKTDDPKLIKFIEKRIETLAAQK